LTEWDPLKGENNHLGCATAVYRSDRKKEVHIFNQAHRIIACHSSSPTQHYFFFDFLFFLKKTKQNSFSQICWRCSSFAPPHYLPKENAESMRVMLKEKKKRKKKKEKEEEDKKKKTPANHPITIQDSLHFHLR
jgi:hypothetical protein